MGLQPCDALQPSEKKAVLKYKHKVIMKKHLKRMLPGRKQFAGGWLSRLLGTSLFSREVWHISRRSVAGGLAVGLFVAFTPTIPFQMLLAAIGAIWFKVNLPLALTVCWISNPFTALPIYLIEYRIGRFIIDRLPVFLAGFSEEASSTARTFFVRTVCLWTGALLTSTVMAVTGYALVMSGWRYSIRRAWASRKEKRQARRDTMAGGDNHETHETHEKGDDQSF